MLKKANEEGVETFLALFHITCSANKVLSSAIPTTTLLHWKSNNHCSSSKNIFIKYCEIKSLRYTLDMTFQHNSTTDKNTMPHTVWLHDCSFISVILPLDEFHNNKLWANLYGCAKLLNTKDHRLLSPPNEACSMSTSNDLTGINHGHT